LARPCLPKRFRGTSDVGATLKELAYIMALTFRESAGGDDCWTHDALGDVKELMAGNVCCCGR
jgi:hypothetical protein